MKNTITFLLFLLPLLHFGQTKSFEDYTPHSKYEGDLNGDKQLDKIVVYQKTATV